MIDIKRGRSRSRSTFKIMNKLDILATKAFDAILVRMNGVQHLKMENEPFLPLTIECIGLDVGTPYGAGKLYSLCHYYVQNGDLMQDPEMCFVIVDNRTESEQYPELLSIFPYMYQLAALGIFQESILMENNRLTKFNRRMQNEHTVFANQWLRNIKSQGYANAGDHENTK
jgi:hypothetical protein